MGGGAFPLTRAFAGCTLFIQSAADDVSVVARNCARLIDDVLRSSLFSSGCRWREDVNLFLAGVLAGAKPETEQLLLLMVSAAKTTTNVVIMLPRFYDLHNI